MDARQVKDLLNARIVEVCEFLLPAGYVKGHQYTVSDLNNTAPKNKKTGGSLNIELSGGKQGIWCDFADRNNIKGQNLLDLWIAVRRCDFKTAITEAKDWLGVADTKNWTRTTAAQPKEDKVQAKAPLKNLENEFVPLKKDGPVWEWLIVERGISQEALDVYRIGQSKDGTMVVFPSYNADDELLFLKFRSITDKGKMFILPTGGPKMLFGMHVVKPSDGSLFITEGELDALAMYDFEQPAVSVPFGAKSLSASGDNPNDPWIEHDFEWLKLFVDVVLCLDDDEHGLGATKAIAPRIGLHRCRVLAFPRDLKDANKCLLEGVTKDEMWDAVGAAISFDPQNLRKPSDYMKEVWEEFYPAGGVEPGEDPPFNMPFKFRPHEGTVWQGFTKNGKSALLNFCLAFFAARHGVKSLIASMEIKPAKTIKILIRQTLGILKPASEKEFREVMEWLDRYIWVYDCVGVAKPDEMLEVFKYAALRYGVRHFVVDSLMKLDVDERNDWEVKKLLNKFLDFINSLPIHLHMVCHSKKPDARHPDTKYWPGKYDVSGSAHIVDMFPNIVCCWRNRGKEAEMKEAEMMPADTDQEKLSKSAIIKELGYKHDGLFEVQGQREGNGEEPIKHFWYDQYGSWQFWEDSDRTKAFNLLNGPLPDNEESDKPEYKYSNHAEQADMLIDGIDGIDKEIKPDDELLIL